MDMTRDGTNRTLPTNPVRILQASQKVYSASLALIGWLKHATFSIELGAGFATGTYRAIEPKFSDDGFMSLRSAALLPSTVNVLPLIELNTIKVGPPC
jgi:hypothetical protein